jgi:hypothetical protein
VGWDGAEIGSPWGLAKCGSHPATPQRADEEGGNDVAAVGTALRPTRVASLGEGCRGRRVGTSLGMFGTVPQALSRSGAQQLQDILNQTSAERQCVWI